VLFRSGSTTTQHNNQHKTYRPPSTKHQPSPTTTNTTITTTTTHHCHQHPTHQPSTPTQPTTPAKPSQASRPPVIASRPPAWVFLLATMGQRQPASDSQPATSYQPTAASQRQPTARGQGAASQQLTGSVTVGPGACLERPNRSQTSHAINR
jgi:hypothetical protein